MFLPCLVTISPDNLPADPLISSPPMVLAFLAALVGIIFWLDSRPGTKFLFRQLPALVWVYFIPMIATSLGILPTGCALYGGFKNFVLPGALLILLATSDLRSIGKAGLPAILMFLAGSVGIIAGAVISLSLFQSLLPPDAWKGFGALSGSWIGGSVNLVSLREVFETPQNLFSQMLVLDTVVGYCWVGLLISMASRQDRFDRLMGANREILTATREKVQGLTTTGSRAMTLADAAGLVALGLTGGIMCMAMGRVLPEVKGVVNAFAWGILIISLLGILLSFTPVRKLKDCGGQQFGYAGIYLMLAGIGAQADLRAIMDNPCLFMAGVVWMMIHILVMLGAARLLRAPLFFLAVGSTANIGGPASAPLVATVYRPELAPVGLLLAVLGNTVGYYFGYISGLACKWVAGGN